MKKQEFPDTFIRFSNFILKNGNLINILHNIFINIDINICQNRIFFVSSHTIPSFDGHSLSIGTVLEIQIPLVAMQYKELVKAGFDDLLYIKNGREQHGACPLQLIGIETSLVSPVFSYDVFLKTSYPNNYNKILFAKIHINFNTNTLEETTVLNSLTKAIHITNNIKCNPLPGFSESIKIAMDTELLNMRLDSIKQNAYNEYIFDSDHKILELKLLRVSLLEYRINFLKLESPYSEINMILKEFSKDLIICIKDIFSFCEKSNISDYGNIVAGVAIMYADTFFKLFSIRNKYFDDYTLAIRNMYYKSIKELKNIFIDDSNNTDNTGILSKYLDYAYPTRTTLYDLTKTKEKSVYLTEKFSSNDDLVRYYGEDIMRDSEFINRTFNDTLNIKNISGIVDFFPKFDYQDEINTVLRESYVKFNEYYPENKITNKTKKIQFNVNIQNEVYSSNISILINSLEYHKWMKNKNLVSPCIYVSYHLPVCDDDSIETFKQNVGVTFEGIVAQIIISFSTIKTSEQLELESASVYCNNATIHSANYNAFNIRLVDPTPEYISEKDYRTEWALIKKYNMPNNPFKPLDDFKHFIEFSSKLFNKFDLRELFSSFNVNYARMEVMRVLTNIMETKNCFIDNWYSIVHTYSPNTSYRVYVLPLNMKFNMALLLLNELDHEFFFNKIISFIISKRDTTSNIDKFISFICNSFMSSQLLIKMTKMWNDDIEYDESLIWYLADFTETELIELRGLISDNRINEIYEALCSLYKEKNISRQLKIAYTV
jgi:hypothetical protein